MPNYTEPFENVDEAFQALRENGCSFVLVKSLSGSQDNEKNQVYLGGSSVVFQRIPGTNLETSHSKSIKPKTENPNVLKISQSVDFHWVDPYGTYKAPNTKLIYYPQYPEMRLSGFIKGTQKSPMALRRNFQKRFGERYLLLGITKESVLGVVVTRRETSGCEVLESLPRWTSSKIFRIRKFSVGKNSIDGASLIKEIKKIAGTGPHKSVTLDRVDELPRDFRGWQGGGYTLEALLGIPRNSISAPDKNGFEIKTFNKSSITLITTEPDFGIRQTDGLRVFLKRFGWNGAKDDGSLRFNGRHYLDGKSAARSKLKLVIRHWDTVNNQPTGTGTPVICLVNSRNEIAAGWSLDRLTESWMKKHAGAVYVETKPIQCSTDKHPRAYDFNGRIYKCEGTSTLQLVRALLDGIIFLDSGDRELANGEGKKRTQWRLAGNNSRLRPLLERIYDQVTDESF